MQLAPLARALLALRSGLSLVSVAELVDLIQQGAQKFPLRLVCHHFYQQRMRPSLQTSLQQLSSLVPELRSRLRGSRWDRGHAFDGRPEVPK